MTDTEELNLFHTGSYQDLKAAVTNSAQTLQSSNSTHIFQIMHNLTGTTQT